MWKCSHCHREFDYTRTTEKANHSRWCEDNPKAAEFRDYQTKLDVVNAVNDKKLGKKAEYRVNCEKCGCEFGIVEREGKHPRKEKYYCSRSCANSHVVSASHRRRSRESLIRYNAMMGRVPIDRVCRNCGTAYTTYRVGSRYCSTSCMGASRSAAARAARTAFDNYRSDCQFKFRLNDYPDKFDFSLIEQFGWYAAKNRGNNLGGVSRDHMLSVRHGFDNDIDPKIIAHPANCRLMRHGENSSKCSKCSISLDELMVRIAEWDAEYSLDNVT